MKTVLVAGGTGLIGSRLIDFFLEEGWKARVLTRSPERHSKQDVDYVFWDPMNGVIDDAAFEGVDSLVNLAGAGIADELWTKKVKKNILESRIKSLQVLGKAIDDQGAKLDSFVSASAIGIYGDRGAEILTEKSDISPSSQFIVEVCKQWEDTFRHIAPRDCKNSIIRIGIVLSSNGGALSKLVLGSNMRMGIVFDSGGQQISWIHIDDLCRLIIHHIKDSEAPSLSVINGTSPIPITHNQLVIASVRALMNKDPLFILRIPSLFIKLMTGDLSQAILMSNHVLPAYSLSRGFKFRHTNVRDALNQIVSK